LLAAFGLTVAFSPCEGKLDGQHKLHALAAEVEPLTGNVWVVTEKDVVKIDKKGRVLVRVKHKAKTTQAWIAGF
jgi:hypothetical protein